MTFYAVQHTQTGNFLPQPPGGKGHTFWEPTSPEALPPRLHLTARRATQALHAWLQGKWKKTFIHTDYGKEFGGYEPHIVPTRKAKDMRIVRLDVEIEDVVDSKGHSR